MTQSTPSPVPLALPGDSSASPTYRVTLPEFEGPLDLLLHLCETHEIDILNISVAFVAEKYIEYLELMQNMAVEVAADYLVMAAHLAYLKSRELVPSPEPLEASEDGEEPLDPRQELIRRLLEYQKYKYAAEDLGSRPVEGRDVFVRGAVLQAEGEAGFAEQSVWKLLEHWANTLKKAKPEHTHDVIVDRISISDRINQIVDLLEAGKGMVRFDDMIGQDSAPAKVRHEVVVSLLAVLELARLRVIRILQQESTGAFFLAQVEGAVLEDARHLRVTSAKETASPPAEVKAPVELPAVSEPPPEEAPAGADQGQADAPLAESTGKTAAATAPGEAAADYHSQEPTAEIPSEAGRLRAQEEVPCSSPPASGRASEEAATDGQEEQTTSEK
jgi:segregation and condensation protein A